MLVQNDAQYEALGQGWFDSPGKCGLKLEIATHSGGVEKIQMAKDQSATAAAADSTEDDLASLSEDELRGMASVKLNISEKKLRGKTKAELLEMLKA